MKTTKEIEQSVHFAQPTNLREMLADSLAERSDKTGDPWANPLPSDLRFSDVDHDPNGTKILTTGTVTADGIPTYHFQLAYGTNQQKVAVYDEFEVVFSNPKA